VVRLAANLFAAGQETTVRMLAAAVQALAEDAEPQQRLRHQRDLIPGFIEEILRFESPIKGDFRLSKVPVTVGSADLPAGTTLMVLNGAANRDPRKFDHPGELLPERDNAREYLAFGYGTHYCPGAPLARAEGRITAAAPSSTLPQVPASPPESGCCPYRAAKAGVAQFTRCLAVEVGAHGIRANCIAPANISTDINAAFDKATVARLQPLPH
jgi:cytochrome P450